MRRLAVSLGAVAIGVGIILVGLLVSSPLPRARLLDGYLLFVGGLVMVGLVQATRAAGGHVEVSPYELALRRRGPRTGRPPELERLEREVALAASSSFYLHFRLRPILREIAAHRLEAGRGADLDAGSPETRAALGEELWEIVRPDRKPPDDRLAPGLPLPRLRAAVEMLEQL